MNAHRLDLGMCAWELDLYNPIRPRLCEEPAVAVWSWDGLNDHFPVCAEHDARVAEIEASAGQYSPNPVLPGDRGF